MFSVEVDSPKGNVWTIFAGPDAQKSPSGKAIPSVGLGWELETVHGKWDTRAPDQAGGVSIGKRPYVSRRTSRAVLGLMQASPLFTHFPEEAQLLVTCTCIPLTSFKWIIFVPLALGLL